MPRKPKQTFPNPPVTSRDKNPANMVIKDTTGHVLVRINRTTEIMCHPKEVAAKCAKHGIEVPEHLKL